VKECLLARHMTTFLAESSQADAFVFPSLSEGCALVNLQAAATGLPLIAMSESGSPDCALNVGRRDSSSLSQALKRLLDEPESIEQLSRASLEAAAKRTEERYRAVFSAVAARDARVPD